MDANCCSSNSIIAPFVMKTYQMVDDLSTNGFIGWGTANNTFIVLQPLDFSQRILPVYFKHNNFSSFVRQLNTYGFRKVDPDRWEFANEWFLRGQMHLLNNIVRRKHSSNKIYTSHLIKHEDDEDRELIVEIAKLKQQQKGLDQELESMNRRLEATERRPQQMMTFLYKVMDDPEILPRMMLEKEKLRRLTFNNCEKKRKLVISADSSNSSSGVAQSSSSIKSREDNDGNTIREATPLSSTDGDFDVDTYCQSSPSLEISPHHEWLRHQNYASLPSSALIGSSSIRIGFSGDERPMNGVIRGYNDSGGVGMNYFDGLMAGESSSLPPPYPFSLLDGGF